MHKNVEGRDYSEELGIDGRIILECNMVKKYEILCTGFMWQRIGTSGRSL
jgi:hypothetical protein